MDVFRYKIDTSYFLCHRFALLHNSIRIKSPRLFRTCFHTRIFSKCNFRTHYNFSFSTILIESLRFRNNYRITVASPSKIVKAVNMSFLNIMLCFYFSLEAVLQSVAKNNSTRIQAILKHAPARTLTEGKM